MTEADGRPLMDAGRRVLREVRRRGQLDRREALLVAGGGPAHATPAVDWAERRLHAAGDLLLDPSQARIAQRRLLATLRRVHRSDPLSGDVRVDALLARLHQTDDQRPASHRGAARLLLDDRALRAIVDELVAEGRLIRRGHRIRLPEHVPQLGVAMRRRADAFLAELRASGASPPRAEQVARRLGLPDAVLAYLREQGELVSVAPDIDYPADVYRRLTDAARALRDERRLTVSALRDVIGGSRRYAAALVRVLEDEPA